MSKINNQKWRAQPASVPVAFLGALTLIAVAVSVADEMEVLQITVDTPTKLSDKVHQNTATVMISNTGVVGAFYPKHGKETHPRADRGWAAQWHCHSDERGYFHWSAEAPVPTRVKLKRALLQG